MTLIEHQQKYLYYYQVRYINMRGEAILHQPEEWSNIAPKAAKDSSRC